MTSLQQQQQQQQQEPLPPVMTLTVDTDSSHENLVRTSSMSSRRSNSKKKLGQLPSSQESSLDDGNNSNSNSNLSGGNYSSRGSVSLRGKAPSTRQLLCDIEEDAALNSDEINLSEVAFPTSSSNEGSLSLTKDHKKVVKDTPATLMKGTVSKDDDDEVSLDLLQDTQHKSNSTNNNLTLNNNNNNNGSSHNTKSTQPISHHSQGTQPHTNHNNGNGNQTPKESSNSQVQAQMHFQIQQQIEQQLMNSKTAEANNNNGPNHHADTNVHQLVSSLCGDTYFDDETIVTCLTNMMEQYGNVEEEDDGVDEDKKKAFHHGLDRDELMAMVSALTNDHLAQQLKQKRDIQFTDSLLNGSYAAGGGGMKDASAAKSTPFNQQEMGHQSFCSRNTGRSVNSKSRSSRHSMFQVYDPSQDPQVMQARLKIPHLQAATQAQLAAQQQQQAQQQQHFHMSQSMGQIQKTNSHGSSSSHHNHAANHAHAHNQLAMSQSMSKINYNHGVSGGNHINNNSNFGSHASHASSGGGDSHSMSTPGNGNHRVQMPPWAAKKPTSRGSNGSASAASGTRHAQLRQHQSNSFINGKRRSPNHAQHMTSNLNANMSKSLHAPRTSSNMSSPYSPSPTKSPGNNSIRTSTETNSSSEAYLSPASRHSAMSPSSGMMEDNSHRRQHHHQQEPKKLSFLKKLSMVLRGNKKGDHSSGSHGHHDVPSSSRRRLGRRTPSKKRMFYSTNDVSESSATSGFFGVAQNNGGNGNNSFSKPVHLPTNSELDQFMNAMISNAAASQQQQHAKKPGRRLSIQSEHYGTSSGGSNINALLSRRSHCE